MSTEIAIKPNSEINDNFLSQLGRLSQSHRQALGMTAADLSERTKISVTQIMELEEGALDIDLMSLQDLAAALSTTAVILFETVEANNPQQGQ